MPNTFVHGELNTTDVAAAKKFYRAIFDWKLDDMKMGPGQVYTMIKAGESTIGGMQKKPMANAPTMWMNYIQVDDVASTLAKAKKLGATIVVPKLDMAGMGALGVFADPAGAVLGLWQPAPKQAAPKQAAAKQPAAKKPAAKKPAAKKPAAKKPAAKKPAAKKPAAKQAAAKKPAAKKKA